MKIAIVSEFFPPVSVGGAELSAFHLAERLSHHDEVEVVTVDYGPRLKDPPFPVHYLDLPDIQKSGDYEADPRALVESKDRAKRPFSSLKHHLSFGWQLARLARERRYDVIHTQQVDSTLAAYLTRHWHRRPIVTTLRSYRYTSNRWADQVAESSGAMPPDRRTSSQRRFSELKWILPRRALKSCARVFTVSDFVRHVHVNAGVVDSRRATTVYNFMPTIPATLPDRRKLRIRYGLEGPTILFSGRLTAGKGVFLLVKAMEKVVREIPTSRLIVAGGGDQSHLRLLASRRGVDRNVTFEGFVENRKLLEMMSASDLVAVPSLYHEPLGRVLLEAVALDRPIVATRVGGTPEVVSDRENGYLVEPNDERSLGASIVRALNDSELPARASAANARLRDARLNPDRTLERVREGYRAAA